MQRFDELPRENPVTELVAFTHERQVNVYVDEHRIPSSTSAIERRPTDSTTYRDN